MPNKQNKHGPPVMVDSGNRKIISVRQQTAIPDKYCKSTTWHIVWQSDLTPGTGNLCPESYREDIGVYKKLVDRSMKLENNGLRIRYPASDMHARYMEFKE